MANRSNGSRAAIALLLGLLIAIPTRVTSIGVCYGMQGNNLPQPSTVVNLYKSNNIKAMRLYDPNQAALQALKGSNIQLILDVPNSSLQSLASSASAASNWVQTNVKAYSSGVSFKYIAVGNEVIPGNLAQYVLPAMRNIYSALSSAGLQNQIKVSTSVATSVLGGNSSPPSSGFFASDALTYLSPIVKFLASNGAPLLVNVYPYFSYVGNPTQIKLDYALFTSPGTVVTDGQYKYQNLFDAIVDAVYAALEKAGGSNVVIVVSESGWPSAGGTAATISNAKTYNQNLINHVGQGTPRRSGKALETYIFEMFNENEKSAGVEQNFGLFYPNTNPVYSINFT
ncbi:glucan endo-1,3-beta-glucosidase-like [Phoenix dactylifera]|uniref:Glucan endo-1,3-beta-glucosidase-like n=1 Tax=Phoenix dactylifera TaxID=42345 RepID=A0A8B8ZKG6_PHODC|nr:glucan endo-1,3-beta-glucosidase-like [Phoenix dactylifera]